MIKKFSLFFLFTLIIFPVNAFVKQRNFDDLGVKEKDKIFQYILTQLPSLDSTKIDNSVYPYKLSEIRNEQNFYLIHNAVSKNSIPIIKYLIKAGIDLNAKSNAGISPLQIAIFNKNLAIVKLLIDNGASISQKNDNGQTPLIVATAVGSKPIIEYLLDQGANINTQDNNGFSPLIQSIIDQNTEITDLYLQKGADINIRTKFRRTPLHFAVQSGNFNLVKKLVESGANINARDYDIQNPNTPLNLAYQQNSNVGISYNPGRIKEYLLAHGAKLGKPYYTNNFALSIMYAYGSPIDNRIFNKNSRSPITINYTGVNLRYYVQPDMSLSWTYAYGFINEYKNHGAIMAPAGLLGIQSLFSFLQTDYNSMLAGPAKGFFKTLMIISAFLPEGISWDIHIANTPYMNFGIELDWAKAYYILDFSKNKEPMNYQMTAEIQGRMDILVGEHFLLSSNISVGFSYTQLAFVWGLGISAGALF